MSYQPGKARVSEHTPQTHFDEFTDDEVMAEIRYLMATNRKYGTNPLRTATYLKLAKRLQDRIDARK